MASRRAGSTFSQAGRDLTGWGTLRSLVETLFAKTEVAEMRGTIGYERQMPPTSRETDASIDLKAGTSVMWSMDEDMLDHHHEIRRIERQAAAWRALLPSRMDWEGYSDADCSIDVTRDTIHCLVMRNDGEDTDSSLEITQTLVDGAWRTVVEISFVDEMCDSDRLAMSNEDAGEMVGQRLWNTGGAQPIGWRRENGEFYVRYAPAMLLTMEDKQ